MIKRNFILKNYDPNTIYKIPKFTKTSEVTIEKISSVTLLSNTIQDTDLIGKSENNKSFQFKSEEIKLDSLNLVTTSIKKLITEWRDVIEVKFSKNSNLDIDFIPGDSLGIHCPNNLSFVKNIFQILELDASDQNFRITRKGIKSKTNDFIFEGTLFDFFTNIFDFRSIPKKVFLYSLSQTTTNKKTKNMLEYLCSKEGSNDYFRIYTEWITIIDIINFFNCKPSLEILIEHCNIIKMRYFSLINKIGNEPQIFVGLISKKISDYILIDKCDDIGSSVNSEIDTSKNDIRIEKGNLDSLIEVDFTKPQKNINVNYINNTDNNFIILYGQCSDYFNTLVNNKTQKVCLNGVIRENKLMRMKKSPKYLLIATGTGIAPFLSFIENNENKSEIWLIYGCRSEKDDLSIYIHKRAFKKKSITILSGGYENIYLEDLTILKKTVIFSKNGLRTTDYIQKDWENISKFVENNCFVYICGNMSMQKDISDILLKKLENLKVNQNLFVDNWY